MNNPYHVFEQHQEAIEDYRKDIALPDDLALEAAQNAAQIVEQVKPRLLAKYNSLLNEFKTYYNNNKDWAQQFLTNRRNNPPGGLGNDDLDRNFTNYSVLQFQLYNKEINDNMIQDFLIEDFIHNNYNKLVQIYVIPIKAGLPNYISYKKYLYNTIQKLVTNKFVNYYFNSDDANNIRFYLHYFSQIMPEIVDKISEFLLPKNYIFVYFTWLKAIPPIQALYGDVELDINSFESHASIFSAPYGESKLMEFNESGKNEFNSDHMTSNDDIKILGGWSKNKLLKAIFNSGLMQPIKKQHNLLNVTLIDTTQPYENYINDKDYYVTDKDLDTNKKYTVMRNSVIITNRAYHSDMYHMMLDNQEQFNINDFTYLRKYISFATKLEAELYMFNKTHALPWKTIGINRPGYINFLYPSNAIRVRSLEMIYRRVFGTIYTINWQVMCSSGRINIYYLPVLEWIANTYLNHKGAIINTINFCEIVTNYTKQLNQVFDQVKDQNSWLRFVISKYNENNDSFKPLKRGAEQQLSNIMSKMKL